MKPRADERRLSPLLRLGIKDVVADAQNKFVYGRIKREREGERRKKK